MRVISLGRLISHHWALSRLMGPEQAVGRTVKAISAISQEASAGRAVGVHNRKSTIVEV